MGGGIVTAVWIILGMIAGLIVGCLTGWIVRRNIAEKTLGSAEQAARKILSDADKAAETKKREAVVAAKEEVMQLRNDLEKETRERRNELQRLERRNLQKEETLDKKSESLERKDESLRQRETAVEATKKKLSDLIAKQMTELERISGLTPDEAKQILLRSVEDEVRYKSAIMIKEAETRTKEESEKKAKDIISQAIQRCAADHVAESTVSVVSLPNDEMKGRIIGREGRNIRALETLTGVDLIIDDTPEAVILSSFDPIRREVARLALEKLILDGRIHPARIEEMVEKSQKEVEQKIREEGEQATFEASVHGLHPEIVKLLGRLKFRTSYGQNVLKHSVEVAHLSGLMASELGVDAQLAKRAGLLHDLGKAVDHDTEGTHVQIGIDICKRYKESPEVLHAIEAHHGDVEAKSTVAVLVAAADAVSAARPGARRETLETYIKRLQKLEEIAEGFEGVEKSYAIQAGREIRIIVNSEKIDDALAPRMAYDVAKRIEEELEYPGQIRVVVLRETRAVDYAK
ncbi:MAG: ribonuclease Y [Peptococcaceae bacterium]|nr:ribonuclease Y [Peptococcaceae bacterium]